MTWSHHIQAIVNKATKMLNFVKRTLHHCDAEVKATTYSILVRPTLEYATVIWDPYQEYLINNNKNGTTECSQLGETRKMLIV